ncbi:hypothetical protein CRENBAI_008668 [Crenichthys baileyi]|uniref:Uncharacterized protein n=1 Tax=Crenichthys baileyi TaxID=28760 RepID=A0AAV9S7M0_9TELE
MRLKLPAACFILEIILIILFGVLVEYDHDTDAKLFNKDMTDSKANEHHGHAAGTSHNISSHNAEYENDFYYRYPKPDSVKVCICTKHLRTDAKTQTLTRKPHTQPPITKAPHPPPLTQAVAPTFNELQRSHRQSEEEGDERGRHTQEPSDSHMTPGDGPHPPVTQQGQVLEAPETCASPAPMAVVVILCLNQAGIKMMFFSYMVHVEKVLSWMPFLTQPYSFIRASDQHK